MKLLDDTIYCASGPRVRLRPWKSSDEQERRMWPAYADPLSHLWNLPRTRSRGNEFFSFLRSPASERWMWAIEMTDDGTLIGRISLRDIDRWRCHARLGISLVASWVGHGLGTEAMCLFLDYFFEQAGFSTMLLDVAAFNQRAVRCYENLGFARVRVEWRDTDNDACAQIFDDPASHHLRPFFRREGRVTQVQFLEMSLHKQLWHRHVCHLERESHHVSHCW